MSVKEYWQLFGFRKLYACHWRPIPIFIRPRFPLDLQGLNIFLWTFEGKWRDVFLTYHWFVNFLTGDILQSLRSWFQFLNELEKVYPICRRSCYITNKIGKIDNFKIKSGSFVIDSDTEMTAFDSKFMFTNGAGESMSILFLNF